MSRIYNLIYLNPDDVDTREPPITVSRIKNNDKSVLDEYTDIPDVESDEVIAKKTLLSLSWGIIKK